MNIQIWIQPHERGEALEAYRQWLTVEQENKIKQAPDDASIHLLRLDGKTSVHILSE